MSSVTLKNGRERRLVAGHSWVYAGEIDTTTGDPADGDVVDIRDQRKRFLGCGWFNRRSQITVRRFSTHKEEADRDFFRRRLTAALALRRRLGHDPADAHTAFRVAFSEADLVPGLILDKYGDCLVLQTLTLGVDQRRDLILEVVEELFQPRSIVERNDVPSRRREGLSESRSVLRGQTDGRAVIRLGEGLEFEVNLLEHQKTGFYLDQQTNYATVARHAAGRRVLDCFSYHGGFALAAARAGASGVEVVESSEGAIAQARHNTERNKLTGKLEFICANAFDVLKRCDTERRRFDLIVLDPPSFTRTKDKLDDAVRGYKEINLRALRMLPVGGMLATFSCAHHMDAELFRTVVLDAAADARRQLRLVEVLTQSADHPILPAVPETEYLKGLLVEVVDAPPPAAAKPSSSDTESQTS